MVLAVTGFGIETRVNIAPKANEPSRLSSLAIRFSRKMRLYAVPSEANVFNSVLNGLVLVLVACTGTTLKPWLQSFKSSQQPYKRSHPSMTCWSDTSTTQI
jgi:hypothetical protein